MGNKCNGDHKYPVRGYTDTLSRTTQRGKNKPQRPFYKEEKTGIARAHNYIARSRGYSVLTTEIRVYPYSFLDVTTNGAYKKIIAPVENG